MAEGLLSMSRADDDEHSVIHTQGRPISPADEIRIVDENDQEVPAGVTGELLTRGPYTLHGYYPRRSTTGRPSPRTGSTAPVTWPSSPPKDG